MQTLGMLIRRIARPLMALVFLSGGIEVFRDPGPRVMRAEPVTRKLAETLPLPDDTETLVKLNAAVHIGAGTLLALGRLPRLSAAVLAASLMPTTLAGHRWWEEESELFKAMQRMAFIKNVAILGGLMIAATETEKGRR